MSYNVHVGSVSQGNVDTNLSQLKANKHTMMDLAALRAKVSQAQSAIEAKKASGTKIAKFPSGTSRWRILPGWRSDEPLNFYHPFGQHWIKDANGKIVAVVVCEWATYERPCAFDGPIKEAIRSTTDDGMIKALKDLGANKTILVNMVQIPLPPGTPGAAAFDQANAGVPVLMGLPNGVFEKYINLLGTRAVDDINILDLAEGRDIIVTKSGVGMGTEYAVADAAKSTTIDPSVMTKITNIDAFIKAEFDKSQQVSVNVLNQAIARIMGVAAPSTARTASLVGSGVTASLGAGAAAALSLAPPAEVASPALVNPVVETPAAVVKPVETVAVAAAPAAEFSAPLADSDLDKLLAELG